MLTLKRFLCSILTLCSLTIMAADSTIGNLTPITVVPDAYRMPWENPGVVDYYITFANLTNQVLNGMASQAYAQGLTNNFAYTNWVGANYYPLANPSNFVGSSALSGYALLAGTNLFTATNTLEKDALGTTITPIVYLTNATAAALGAQQVSPALMFGGQGWRSGNSTTMPVQMGMYVLPVQGSSANPSANMHVVSSISNSAPASTGLFFNTSGGLTANDEVASLNSIVAGTSSYFRWPSKTRISSPSDGDVQLQNNGLNSFNKIVLGPTTSNWPAIKVESSTNNPTLSIRTGADANYASLVASNVTASGFISATNNITWQAKATFTTNFTATTNIAIYCCSGTNQLITLPNCTTTPPFQIYRFSSTNGYGSFILTNATGTQTIRDGTSLSFTQIGIGSPSFYHDGAHWWPAARTKTIMANAQFSCSTNIPMTAASTAYPVTFNSTDFNNSQGIALLAGTNGLLSKMWITNSGEYEFSPSIVINFGGNNTVTTWFRSNGTNVPNSATAIKGAAGGSIRCVTIPFEVNVTQPTAFELWVLSSSTGDALSFQAAGGVAPNDYPLSPSVICPVKKISDHYP